MKKIVYYTYPFYLGVSLGLIRSVSKLVDLHVILEITPESRQGAILNLTSIPLKSGVIPAVPILTSVLPKSIENYWKNLASFHLAVFNHPKSIQIDTIRKGLSIAHLLRDIEPDLIFFDDVSLRIALGSLFFRNIPWVVGVHDPKPHSGETDCRTMLARKIMYSNARHFILHNQSQRTIFRDGIQIQDTHISTIPLGISNIYREWDRAIRNQANRNILFFGRLSPYKGLDVLLQAAVAVCQQISDVTFTIAGRPIRGYKPPPMPLLPNGGRIIFLQQYISTDELSCLFHKATCVVCPYIDATQSGVVLIAYAFNKPVIASRVGGLPEYVKDGRTGLLVEPSDPGALADAIVLLLEDRRLLSKLENGISVIQKNDLSWGTISSQYVAVFENIIRKR